MNVLHSAGLNTVSPDLTPMPVSVDAACQPGQRRLASALADPAGRRKRRARPGGRRQNSTALSERAAQHEGVVWIDRKASFDSLFALYRTLLTGLLCVALAAIACGAIIRLGWRQGLISLVPSVLSLSCGLAALAVAGHSVNLFSLLALLLVLGIGINYTLFSATHAARR